MKSCRLNSVALTWLQGGHHTAPQYRNSGLLSVLAATKAASTSPLRQAIPSPCAEPATGGAPPAAAESVTDAPLDFGAGVGEQAASTSVRARMSWRGRIVMGIGGQRRFPVGYHRRGECDASGGEGCRRRGFVPRGANRPQSGRSL